VANPAIFRVMCVDFIRGEVLQHCLKSASRIAVGNLFNDTFSNVKLDRNIRICGLRRRTDRTGENFVKLGVNFRGMGVHFIRGEVLPHCLKSVSRIAVGNLF